MRRKIYSIIASNDSHKLNHAYDIIMIIAIVFSLAPLAFKETPTFLTVIEHITTVIFIIDYLLRYMTADFKLGKGAISFLIYPFTAMAIIDLLSVLPSLIIINSSLRVLKAFRFIRALKVLKAFKSFRYSKNIEIIASVFKKQKKSLTTVCVLAIGYILISALTVFNVEPDTFNSFFDALYWATISLTTVGYGDIYTVSAVGKVVTMISSILGIAIVALPSGIITAGYMNEINKEKDEKKDDEEQS